jgi:putative heme iron utilization protein
MTPAEEARALVAAASVAALATLSEDGAPWSSLVEYTPLADGRPVLCLSTLAEHGRNVARDPRASLMVSDGAGLAGARVTLTGRVRPATEQERTAPPFGDFTCYVLEVEGVRWVGGYGRMATVDVADYRETR